MDAPAAAQPQTAKGEVTVTEPTRAQQAVARRMAESAATIPAATVGAEADVEAALARCDDSVGLRDLAVRALALALADHPRANGAWRDGRFERYSRVNVGVVVAVPDGLVAPTLFDADRRPAAELAKATGELAGRAREGSITSPEVSGGTCTLWTADDAGVTHLEPLVAPSQAVALALGAPAIRPVVRDGDVVARHVVTLTLACDQRVLPGPEGAGLLARVRELLERPDALR